MKGNRNIAKTVEIIVSSLNSIVKANPGIEMDNTGLIGTYIIILII